MNILLGILYNLEAILFLFCTVVIVRSLVGLLDQRRRTLRAQEQFIYSELDRF